MGKAMTRHDRWLDLAYRLAWAFDSGGTSPYSRKEHATAFFDVADAVSTGLERHPAGWDASFSERVAAERFRMRTHASGRREVKSDARDCLSLKALRLAYAVAYDAPGPVGRHDLLALARTLDGMPGHGEEAKRMRAHARDRAPAPTDVLHPVRFAVPFFAPAATGYSSAVERRARGSRCARGTSARPCRARPAGRTTRWRTRTAGSPPTGQVLPAAPARDRRGDTSAADAVAAALARCGTLSVIDGVVHRTTAVPRLTLVGTRAMDGDEERIDLSLGWSTGDLSSWDAQEIGSPVHGTGGSWDVWRDLSIPIADPETLDRVVDEWERLAGEPMPRARAHPPVTWLDPSLAPDDAGRPGRVRGVRPAGVGLRGRPRGHAGRRWAGAGCVPRRRAAPRIPRGRHDAARGPSRRRGARVRDGTRGDDGRHGDDLRIPALSRAVPGAERAYSNRTGAAMSR